MPAIEIVRTEGVLGGEPRLEGRRISVVQIADMVRDAGHSVEHVADQLAISPAEVRAALDYYDAHPAEIDRVRARHEELEELLARLATPPRRPDA